MDIVRRILAVLTIIVIFVACKDNGDNRQSKEQKEIKKHFVLAKPVPVEELLQKIPELAFYHQKLTEALQKDPPILLLDDSEIRDEKMKKAHTEFIKELWSKHTPTTPLKNMNEVIILASIVEGNGNSLRKK